MVPTKPRLVFAATVQRRRFFRRFAWSLLATVAALGALVALSHASLTDRVSPDILRLGQIIAIIVAVLFALRTLLNLWRGLRRRNETLRFYDQGFVWIRDGQQHKYGWSGLATFREGVRGLYIGKRPLLQWGAHTLKTRDGKVFKVTGAHGNMRQFARAVRRHIAHEMGIRMARTLRAEKPVRLHPRLTVWPGGVEVNKQEIPWAELDLQLRRGRLIVRRRTQAGTLKTVARYSARSIDNLGGFLELATGTIQNYRRQS